LRVCQGDWYEDCTAFWRKGGEDEDGEEEDPISPRRRMFFSMRSFPIGNYPTRLLMF